MKKPRMCDQNDVQLDVKYELETPVNYTVLKCVFHIGVLFSLLLSVLEIFNVQLLLRTVLTVGGSY